MMTILPTVSIIVLNWNGKQYLQNCLSSLLRQRYSNIEIIFVDNGSTDGSVEFIAVSWHCRGSTLPPSKMLRYYDRKIIDSAGINVVERCLMK